MCLQQVQEEEYYPVKVPFTFPTLPVVLLSHNGLAFDFPFIVAKVKRWKLDEEFNITNLSFADTLHDVRRVGKKYYQHIFSLFLLHTACERRTFNFHWLGCTRKEKVGTGKSLQYVFSLNGNIVHNFKCNNIKPTSSLSNGGCQSHEENFLLQLVSSCFVQPEYLKQE